MLDIVHADQKLYLVFEFLDVDLKRYMENGNRSNNPISLDLVKVITIPILQRTRNACVKRVYQRCGAS